MSSWIRCYLPLFVLAIPLSTAQAAPIEVVAFDGHNPEFRFLTFGLQYNRAPAVDEAGRVYFKAATPTPGGGVSDGSFVWENGIVRSSTRTFPQPASLPDAGDPVPGHPGVTWRFDPAAKINRNGVALIDTKFQSRSIPAGVVVYDAAGVGTYLVSALDTAPGTGGRVFSEFNSQTGPQPGGGGPTALAADLNDRGDLVFEASLGRLPDQGRINAAGFGIWTRPGGNGPVTPLVLSGTAVPGLANRTFHRFTRTEIDASGRVAFISELSDPTEKIEHALFFAGPEGDIMLAARKGDPVAGGPKDLRVTVLDDLFLTDAGLAVMTVGTNQGDAIVSVSAEGKLELLLREGQEILIGDRERRIIRFTLFSNNLFQRFITPDFGPLVGDWLTVGVVFGTEDPEEVDSRGAPDGQAILRIRVPEPGLAALMILAAVAIRRVAWG